MINGVTLRVNIDEYIMNALKEDITYEDVSANAVMPEDIDGKADLICKQDGIICGLDIFKRTFELLDGKSRFEANFKDGDFVKNGELIGVIYGDIKTILSGERTALNYLQRMSGIATITKEYADELKDFSATLLDTRKATPNMRPFEKYAVTVGGGTNHRYNLSDGVLLKDNHISAAGSITKAVEAAKTYAPFVRKIEVETETLDQVREAADAGTDIIMLDNMDNETMKKAIEIIAGRAKTECSGNVTKKRLREIAELGVDYISCGALTHSAPVMDISLKNLVPVK
ncbi:MAG: carboxylating nicotinate-nucleotide diphosphorylase [Clostridiales bacterium]|nr:carboxylating nicotinate-nucleotide diphosphorylase [Clostridiales bacterium]